MFSFLSKLNSLHEGNSKARDPGHLDSFLCKSWMAYF